MATMNPIQKCVSSSKWGTVSKCIINQMFFNSHMCTNSKFYPLEEVLQELFLFLCTSHQSKSVPQNCHELSHGNDLPSWSSRLGKHLDWSWLFDVPGHTVCCQWPLTSCGTSYCSSTWLGISGIH